MKVLAVDEPLSLQVHPSAEQARLGYAREDAAGLPLDAARAQLPRPPRTSPSCSSRSPASRAWPGSATSTARPTCCGCCRCRGPGRRRRPAPRRRPARGAARRRHRHPRHRGAPAGPRSSPTWATPPATPRPAPAARRSATGPATSAPDAEAVRVFARLGDLVRRYPRDPGVLVTLLLNNVLLTPGEALFVDAGMVHAYASGFGVEIMASSDNVRAGRPHAQAPRRRRAARHHQLRPGPPAALAARRERRRAAPCSEPPVAEFSLTVGRPPLRRLPATGPAHRARARRRGGGDHRRRPRSRCAGDSRCSSATPTAR